MNAGVIRAFRGQPAQQRLGIAEAAGLHIDVGEADAASVLWVEVRIERQDLFVLCFGVRKFFCRSCSNPAERCGSGSFGVSSGSLPVSLERVFRLFIFEQMRECEPGAGLTFFRRDAVGLRVVAARKNCSASGLLARASIRPRLRFDSKTSGLAATDLR